MRMFVEPLISGLCSPRHCRKQYVCVFLVKQDLLVGHPCDVTVRPMPYMRMPYMREPYMREAYMTETQTARFLFAQQKLHTHTHTHKHNMSCD